jgi:hypothetical protein
VFVFIDDNNFKLDNALIKAESSGLSLIQIEEYECRSAGLFNFNATFRAGDKALYHFCCRDLSDDTIWLIEDEVAIDRKYGNADIISAGQHSEQIRRA